MMNTVELAARVPTAWVAALKTVQKVCPSAVIAGGALRDLALGGRVKDIDIFIPYSQSEGINLNHWAMPMASWHRTKNLVIGGYATGLREEVQTVEEYLVPGLDMPIQVIALDVPVEDFAHQCISRMDFDACRIAFDGVQVIASIGAIVALTHRRMTLVKCEDATQAARSLRRADSFRLRYPDMPIDITLAERFA